MDEYKLRCTLVGHSSDVRSIATTENGDVVTASRDKTSRLWSTTITDDDCLFEHQISYTGHTGYVTSVCVAAKSEAHPEGLVISGSRDSTILVFTANKSTAEHTLTGHSDTVSCLAWDARGYIASGSWDHSARLWKNWQCCHTLKGHTGPIWAIAFLPATTNELDQIKVLSASADKTIKLWINDKAVTTYKGHTDCVRGLAILDADRFFSCSNDASVRLWMVSGECLSTFYGHTNFIYSVSILDCHGGFITGGEDRTLRVWGPEGNCIQTLHVPAQSVWSVAALPNSDIVCGSSDGSCRIFTKVPERQANEADQKEFSESVAKSEVPMDLGGVKKSDLPGKEFLHTPGKRDGQTMMIQEDDKVFCYSWSSSKQQWDKVGEVVGGAGGSAVTSGKVLYQGKEYDYVFDVDLDGENTIKLPYNSNEDPWVVSQQFIHRHELSQDYLDQVANFIVKNASTSETAMDSSYQDPFTGGSRYVPRGGAQNSTASGSDPFTGGGRYIPGQSSSSTPQRSSAVQSHFFPQIMPLQFESFNADGMLNKLKESNVLVDAKLTDEQIEVLVKSAVTADCNPKDLAPLELALQWPAERVWPALDILRLALKSNKLQEAWIDGQGEGILNLLMGFIRQPNPTTTQLLALRCLANLACHSPGCKLLLTARDNIVSAVVNISPYPNKNMEIAAATILLNYSVLLKTNAAAENIIQVLSGIAAIALCVKDTEAQFRTLVALGTLVSVMGDEGKSLINSLDLEPVVKLLTEVSQPAKVGECARHIMRLL